MEERTFTEKKERGDTRKESGERQTKEGQWMVNGIINLMRLVG